MNDNVNESRLDALLKLTSQRLGTTPEELKKAAQSGDLSKMMNNAGNGETEALKKVLNDPEAAKKLLSTPQAQKLIAMLQNGKQGN